MFVAELLKCSPVYFSRMFWLWSKVKAMCSGEVVFQLFDFCCYIAPTQGRTVPSQMAGSGGVIVPAMGPFPMAWAVVQM